MKRLYTLLFALCFGATFAHAQSILSADFEGSLGADWTAENVWTHGNGATLSSTYLGFPDHTDFMAANDDALGANVDGSGKLISPVFDLSTASNPVLSFDAHFFNGDYQGADETAKVMITFDGGTFWTEIYNIDEGAQNQEWHSHSVSLADYIGVATVQIAFDYQDANQWNYGFAVDDVAIFEPLDWDVAVSDFELERYHEGPSTTPVSFNVTNNGANTVTSFDVHWTNGTDTYTETITGQMLEFGDTYTVTHGTAATIAAASLQDIDVWVDNLDGNMDMDDSNNMASDDVVGLSFVPTKKVVYEEGTGTWCPWCTRGIVGLDYMIDAYPETFIGIAVHNGDPMTITEYDSNLDVGGYPSGFLDRMSEIDPGVAALEPAYNAQINVLSPVGVSMTGSFHEGTRELEITMTSTFAAPFTSDIRFNLVITEDGVTGTGSGYDQANAYAGGGNGPMGGFENLPATIPASEMVYDHVARAILGDWPGTANSIPASVDFNDEASYTYTYTVPADYDVENMHFVAMVIDQGNGSIMNAEQIKYEDLSIEVNIDDIYNETLAEVYPNPFSDVTNIDLKLAELAEVSVQVYNTVGQLVAEQNYGELVGEQILPVDATKFAEGTYFIHVIVGEEVVTKRVTKMK